MEKMVKDGQVMKKVLITGAGGFIGSRTVSAALKRSDWEIHVVTSGKHSRSFPDGIIAHAADLGDSEQTKDLLQSLKPNVLIHLAWALEQRDYEKSSTNLMWVENSLRLLRLFFDEAGQRFVFCGTGAEYGQPGGRFSETAPVITRTVYGSSKLYFEEICKNYCQINGFSFAAARCFSVYGEGDRRMYRAIPSAVMAFSEGKEFVCKSPNNVWDFVHVDDVAEAIVRIAESDYFGSVNVATGHPHLMRNVFKQIAEIMNCPELLRFEENESNTTLLVADPTVLNQKIGFRCETDFDDGLRRTIQWWLHPDQH